MRLPLLLCLVLAAGAAEPAALAAAAAVAPAGLPTMSPKAYAAMVARGDGQLQDQIDAVLRPHQVTTAKVKAQRAEADALEQLRGRFYPAMGAAVGSAGHLEWVLQVVQVIGPQSVLVEDANAAGRALWLDGVSTAEMVDGQVIVTDPAALFEVDSTKTYATTDGATRTVLHVQAVVAPKP